MNQYTEPSYVERKSFEKLSNIPKKVYKYRVWNDVYQKTILTERVVFMAPPSSFEDKKDCKLFKRYDLMTEQDIINKYLEHSRNENSGWTEQQHLAFARRWAAKSPMKSKEYLKKMQEDHFNEFDERFGILCLTGNPLNLEMWKKYSNNGEGYCVGFDPKILFKFLGGGGKVEYYENLPDINHYDDYHIEHYKQVFSKEKKWSFEEEYRTHKFYPKPATILDRKIIIPPEAYIEIIFGWNLSRKHSNPIVQTCKKQKLNVRFNRCVFENDKLEIIPVENF
uniref:DUF2971 domain-containing protein n=1 Tax=Roseihalotalea indica TaxID=2867963 RepID=A0AA49GKI4_9BACT|nr:DUF2971 domain-containing protein [Tunicatimonas sp. TK19036]